MPKCFFVLVSALLKYLYAKMSKEKNVNVLKCVLANKHTGRDVHGAKIPVPKCLLQIVGVKISLSQYHGNKKKYTWVCWELCTP